MSQAETKRFFGDMANDAALKSGAEGVDGVPALAAYATSKGYDVTVQDLTNLVEENSDLSDEQLEKVAGGFNVDMGVSVGCVVCVSIS